ncbi:restriction endonuclease subunit S [Iamia sp.]|uniref:restriction endonuclease subunit S n=1 Tax=Iamia sp. TaxID=2722710 RepID=UPI002C2C7DA0|nr:restriction endonuclease subunit S [Iamia sp.]HXH56801.1 restriction endonuclease subunit S [Iamia sp.]
MSQWRETTLGEVADLLVGFAFKSAAFSEDPTDVRLLRGVNIGQGFLDWGRGAFWPDHQAHGSRYELEPGDIVLAMDRPWIEAGLKRARLRSGDLPALLVQRVTRLRGTSAVRTSFVHHLIGSETFSRYIQGMVTGTTVPHISQSQIGAFTFRLPPLTDQDVICEVLDALDDLIENNRRRVEVLEEMARAVYREWFVHFRYPGHDDAALVDSPLGPIPEGWEVVPLIGAARVTMGQSPRSEHYNTEGVGKPFHQGVTDFGTHLPTHRKYCTVDGRSATDGDVLVSVRAPVGRLNLADTTLVIGRGLAAVRSRDDGQQSLLFGHLKEVFAEEDSMGGGTIFKAIGKKELEQVQVLRVPSELAERADQVLSAKSDLIRALTFTNRRLASIRDLLLPKLVTGQIDVSSMDLEALVAIGDDLRKPSAESM